MPTRLPFPGRRGTPSPSAIRGARLASLWIILLAAPLGAQSGTARLTLDALYRAVDSQSPRIAAARSEASAALDRVSAAGKLPDPWLQLATMNRELPGFTLTGPMSQNLVQLSQMFPIPGTGKLGLASAAAQAGAAAQQGRATESVWEQRARAAMAFYDLYEAESSLVLMRETRDLLDAVAGSVVGMYAVGEARQADVLRAQLESGRMTGQIADMEAMRLTMVARLNATLGNAPRTPVGSPVLPAFPSAPTLGDSLADSALAARGLLAAAAAQVEATAATAELARREIWPDLELGVGYSWQPMDGGTNSMLSVMLGASLPIWAGSRQLKMRDETAAMHQAAQDELAAARADTRGRIAELDAGLRRATDLQELYAHTLLPQALATSAAARAAYQVGTVDFMTYLDAIMTVYDYRLRLRRLEADEGRAYAELEMVTGRRLVDGRDPNLGDTTGEPQ